MLDLSGELLAKGFRHHIAEDRGQMAVLYVPSSVL